MQFILAASALAALAAAQTVNVDSSYPAGSQATLSITNTNGPYSLRLRNGPSGNLNNVTYIACDVSGPTFQWTPSTQIPDGTDYTIEIVSGSVDNFSNRFAITGGAPAGSQVNIASPQGCPSQGGMTSSSSSSAMTGYGTAAPSTMSTAAKSGSACGVTQIVDGQVQAPATPCPTSSPAYNPAPKVTPMPGYNSAAVPAPYVPMAGATGSPASSNTTMPTYSVPSSPSSSSGSGSGSGSNKPAGTKAPSSGASSFGSSFALIAGAVAAFAFLN